MRRRLVYAPDARDDLRLIGRWLTQIGSGPVAWQTLAKIRTSIRRLQDTPLRWPVGPNLGVRELPCAGGYRAIYEVEPDDGTGRAGDVRVLRVYGPGQDRSTR